MINPSSISCVLHNRHIRALLDRICHKTYMSHVCDIFGRINHTCLHVTYTFVEISDNCLTVYITHFIQWTNFKHRCNYLCPQQQQLALINVNETSPSTSSSRVIFCCKSEVTTLKHIYCDKGIPYECSSW
jgi:hypothetical protein